MGVAALVTLAATTKVLRTRPSSLPCKQDGSSGVNVVERSVLTTKLPKLHPEEQGDAKELEHDPPWGRCAAVLRDVVLQARRKGDEGHGAVEWALIYEDLQKRKCVL